MSAFHSFPATFPAPRRRDRLARLVLRARMRQIRDGQLVVVESGGEGEAFGRAPGVAALRATVAIHTPAAYATALSGGSIGLADGYVNGWWDTDDLVALLRLAVRELPAPSSWLARLAATLSAIRHPRRGGSRANARENIAAHYDLSNEFFSLFLDPSLNYSCALFDPPDASLEQASLNKLERICSLLELRPGMRVLEIGTGWGSFAVHAATRYGCAVTTTTISQRQYEYVQALVASKGLGGQITVLNDDYRDLGGEYDAVASIEMLEAIGWRQYEMFFGTCAQRLRPGGRMALQTIVIDDRVYPRAKNAEDFIKARVFPGSCIPSVAAIVEALAAASDLRVTYLADIGHHYAETMHRWRDQFAKNEEAVAALGFDEAFRRRWDLYLAYCEAGFRERRISDVQMVLQHAVPRVGEES